MKEKILKYIDGYDKCSLKDKLTFEQFVQILIEDDVRLSDLYTLYEEYFDFVKFIYDLVHEDKED